MMTTIKGDVAFDFTERYILWMQTDVDLSEDPIDPPSVIFILSHKTKMSDNNNGLPALPQPPPQPQGRANGGRRAGAGNYTREEQIHFLNIMERILPMGPEEWDQVQLEHEAVYPGRDVDSIRRRYNRLHRKKIPTGDPTMPPEVRQAKRVKYKLGDKSNLGQYID